MSIILLTITKCICRLLIVSFDIWNHLFKLYLCFKSIEFLSYCVTPQHSLSWLMLYYRFIIFRFRWLNNEIIIMVYNVTVHWRPSSLKMSFIIILYLISTFSLLHRILYLFINWWDCFFLWKFIFVIWTVAYEDIVHYILHIHLLLNCVVIIQEWMRFIIHYLNIYR